MPTKIVKSQRSMKAMKKKADEILIALKRHLREEIPCDNSHASAKWWFRDPFEEDTRVPYERKWDVKDWIVRACVECGVAAGPLNPAAEPPFPQISNLWPLAKAVMQRSAAR